MKDPRDIQKGIEFLNDQRGLKYDKTAILGILLRATWRIFGERIYNKVKFMRNMLERKTRFFCSELVEIYAGMTGKRLWHSHSSLTTPFDQFRSEELYDVD